MDEKAHKIKNMKLNLEYENVNNKNYSMNP